MPRISGPIPGTPERASGELVIDLDDTGFHFSVKIQGAGSRGVDNMKVFAFDLTLAELWAEHEVRPNLLFHDSELYDGVDERQIAAALRLAHDGAQAHGFQYFCSMNTDDLPPAALLGELPPEGKGRSPRLERLGDPGLQP
jgi:uncharacterized protein YydD (DUF2326 family)